MRLYSLTKHRFVLVFIAFCAAFVITLIIGIAGPPAIAQHSKTAKELGVLPKNFKVIIYTFCLILLVTEVGKLYITHFSAISYFIKTIFSSPS